MFVSLYIKSKNINSLKEFINFFNKWLKLSDLQIIFFKKQFFKNSQIKKFTVLRSPHVNKKSGEKFQIFVYNNQFYFYSFNNKKLLIAVKSLINTVFPGTKIRLKFIFDKSKVKKIKKIFFNPDYYFFKNKLNIKYLKIFDVFGENSFKF